MKILRLPIFLPASLRFLRSTVPLRLLLVRSHISPEAAKRRPGAFIKRLPLFHRPILLGGVHRISQLPEEPLPMPMPCSQTPVGPIITRLFPALWSARSPLTSTTKTPNKINYFVAQSHGLSIRCLRFVPPLLTTTQDSLPTDG